MNRFKSINPAYLVIACGMALLFTAVDLYRPLMPVDETRYMSVAWEMLQQDNWILPTLNFEPYSHKPPLLFWLIRGMWEIFGVDVWPARIISMLAMGTFLVMTRRLGRALTQNDEGGTRAMLLMATLPAWLVYGSTIMFDTLLGVWVISAMLVLWRLAQGAVFKYWLILGLLLGLGILTKGPVALIYTLPPALLIKVWQNPIPRGWWKGLGLAILLGAAIGLAWAIPAALSGGDAYAEKIFVTQSANRMVNAFDHREPFWFYVPVLLGFLAPFFLMPALWRQTQHLKTIFKTESALRFMVCWVVPVFLLFSAMNSKSIHYMIPILPGFAVAAALMLRGQPVRRPWQAPLWAFAVVAFLHFAGARHLAQYDLSPLASAIEPYKSRPMAAAPKYDGEYGFVLHASKPIDSIGREKLDVANWFAKNPDGIVILRFKDPKQLADYNVLYTQLFREKEYLSIIEKK